jgi:hypothetical protein
MVVCRYLLGALGDLQKHFVRGIEAAILIGSRLRRRRAVVMSKMHSKRC